MELSKKHVVEAILSRGLLRRMRNSAQVSRTGRTKSVPWAPTCGTRGAAAGQKRWQRLREGILGGE